MIPGQLGVGGGEKVPTFVKYEIKYGCMVDVVYNLRVWISFPKKP